MSFISTLPRCIVPNANFYFNRCGAASRLSVYELNSSKSSSFSLGSLAASSSQSTTVKQSSASPSPTGPIHVSSVGNYKWKGCYTEGSNTRALDSAALANYTNMTG